MKKIYTHGLLLLASILFSACGQERNDAIEGSTIESAAKTESAEVKEAVTEVIVNETSVGIEVIKPNANTKPESQSQPSLNEERPLPPLIQPLCPLNCPPISI
jgi:hypothetical protein